MTLGGQNTLLIGQSILLTDTMIEILLTVRNRPFWMSVNEAKREFCMRM